jgi:hypothetical protein
LTGHGGEGDEVGSSMALGVWQWRREISEYVLPSVVLL